MKNLIRQTAMKWWKEMSMIDQSFIAQKYSTLLYGRAAFSLTSREIEMLYLKEQQHLEWWNSKNYETKKRLSEGYIHPTDSGVDPVMFLDDETIREIYLKEHPVLCQHCYSHKKLETGLCSICGKFPTTSQLKENPTEAEVSKEEETVEHAAMKYENRFHKIDEMGETICGYLTTDRPALKECFAHGAAWQKEKDRALIEELYSLLKSYHYQLFGDNSNDTITKAEQHLKK